MDRATFVGWHGSMKPEGRRKTTEDQKIPHASMVLGRIKFTVHQQISRSERSREPRFLP